MWLFDINMTDRVRLSTYQRNSDTEDTQQNWHVRPRSLPSTPNTVSPSVGCRYLFRDSDSQSISRFDWQTKCTIRKTRHRRESRVATWRRCSTTGTRRPRKSNWMCSASTETGERNFYSRSCQDRTTLQRMLQIYEIVKHFGNYIGQNYCKKNHRTEPNVSLSSKLQIHYCSCESTFIAVRRKGLLYDLQSAYTRRYKFGLKYGIVIEAYWNSFAIMLAC